MTKKKIKVRISNYNPTDKFSYGVFLMNILKTHYDVEISEIAPDYCFFNESDYSHTAYPHAIKIFYTGENIHPNFNVCDYAIGFDYLDFGDRYHRFPVYMVSQFYSDAEVTLTKETHFSDTISFTIDDLHKKTGFASFVYSNYLGESAREVFFRTLNVYKRVNSGGGYLNNIGGKVKNKMEFESNHKFSIAFENSSNIGYTTEKLPNALSAKTIPIYWGNPHVGKEFNEKRFINCMNYTSFDDVVEKVKELDQNDDLYLEMIQQPVKADYDFKSAQPLLEKFICHIIDQPISVAKRIRINPVKAADISNQEKINGYITLIRTRTKKSLAAIYKPFKKITLLERLKEVYFRKKMLK
jgi:hypothetical protein